MKTLTFEELAKLPMKYSFGINATDYCARRYINEEWGISKEVFTPRETPGDVYSGFKKPRIIYYRGRGEMYDSPRKFWEAEFLTPWFTFEQKPVRSGWYETDQGMLYWFHPGHCWCKHIGSSPLKPTKWRGLKQIDKGSKQ